MKSFFHFLQYHNAVPIALGIVILGSGATFAATNPEAIYSETRTPLSVDNTYLVGKDLATYSPKVEIVGVTEDEDFYYVAYKLQTIDLKDYVWQDVTRDEVMKVSKIDLGQYRDLGLYVMDQLKQIIGNENARLAETQEAEKKHVSQKVVSVTYGGLVGKFLDETTEVIPGYEPVVTPPVAPVAASAAETAAAAGSASASASHPNVGGLELGVFLSGDPSDTEAPYVQILGSDPVTLQEGGYYLDLGAVAADSGKTEDVELLVYLNGEKKDRIYFASAPVGEWKVVYEARDKAGNIRRVGRTIIVAPAAKVTPSPEPSPPPTPAPAPAPAPEPSPAPASPPLAPEPPSPPPPDTSAASSTESAPSSSPPPSSESLASTTNATSTP